MLRFEHSGKQYAYTQLPLRGQRQNYGHFHGHALTSQLACKKLQAPVEEADYNVLSVIGQHKMTNSNQDL